MEKRLSSKSSFLHFLRFRFVLASNSTPLDTGRVGFRYFGLGVVVFETRR